MKTVTPTFDGKIWRGKAHAYGTHFVVEVFPSVKYPGHYHTCLFCNDDNFVDETNKPIRADAGLMALQFMLKTAGLVVADMAWEELADRAMLKIAQPESAS